MTMKHGRKVLLVLVVLLIGACETKMPENVSGGKANLPAKPSNKEVPAMSNESQNVGEVQPPPSSHKDESVTELAAFVAGNSKILTSQQGGLRGSGGKDTVLVLDHPGTGNEKLGEGKPRTVLLLVRDGAGKLQKAGKNDKIIPCAQCGGMAGDPFGYIQIGNGQVTVLTEGGSRERWSNEYTFRYSAGQRDWLLDKTARTLTDTETGEEKHNDLTSKDFGVVRFEQFDPANLPKMEEK